jgi:hypothetical protein
VKEKRSKPSNLTPGRVSTTFTNSASSTRHLGRSRDRPILIAPELARADGGAVVPSQRSRYRRRALKESSELVESLLEIVEKGLPFGAVIPRC